MAREGKPVGKKDDRRRYRRFTTKKCIRIALMDGTPITSIVAVHDLSEDGLQFSCQDFVKKGNLLDVTVEEGGGRAIRLKGRVVWVQKAPVLHSASIVGVEFMDLDRPTRERLKSIEKKRWWFGVQ